MRRSAPPCVPSPPGFPSRAPIPAYTWSSLEARAFPSPLTPIPGALTGPTFSLPPAPNFIAPPPLSQVRPTGRVGLLPLKEALQMAGGRAGPRAGNRGTRSSWRAPGLVPLRSPGSSPASSQHPHLWGDQPAPFWRGPHSAERRNPAWPRGSSPRHRSPSPPGHRGLCQAQGHLEP